ncbi:hypothetical protein [Bradyrhizobium sp. SZCCHNPS1003]|uniref:hypothetical protein n=1 Tax=Bradyrhizobium sp. SZCCHNPS1003 TaxID=3057330 RepID=UPI0028E3B38C|nr:hypothetical protein [Bradyrhizobium sp. SZCCHNPS1003]
MRGGALPPANRRARLIVLLPEYARALHGLRDVDAGTLERRHHAVHLGLVFQLLDVDLTADELLRLQIGQPSARDAVVDAM